MKEHKDQATRVVDTQYDPPLATARDTQAGPNRLDTNTCIVYYLDMANEALKQMQALAAQMTDEQIREAVEMISSTVLTTESRFVRAHLIEEFISRNGEEAGDELMTAVGL